MEEFTVLLVIVVDPFTDCEADPAGTIPLHSSSNSFSLVMHLPSCRCLSSSWMELSLIVYILFRFTKLLVPGLPANSQLMPFQCYLKFDWICLSLSNADISLGFFGGAAYEAVCPEACEGILPARPPWGGCRLPVLLWFTTCRSCEWFYELCRWSCLRSPLPVCV